MLDVRATLQLMRLDTTFVIFLSVFLPLAVRSRDIADSFGKAVPLLFICICTWIANDLNDVQRDKINHPGRPLPSGLITPEVAGVLYFAALAASLVTTRRYVPDAVEFWYYLILLLSLSYGYVVELFPSAKAVYVAVAISLPLLIVFRYYPSAVGLCRLAAAAFLYTVGKELCMDILDRPGDPRSFLQQVRPNVLAIVAFGFQSAGLATLAGQVTDGIDLLFALGMILLVTASAVSWYLLARPRMAVAIMRLPTLVGLYFLLR